MVKNNRKKFLIAFIPVIHVGYLELLKRYPDGVFVLGDYFVKKFISLTRDIRTIDQRTVVDMIRATGYPGRIDVLDDVSAHGLAKEDCDIVMPKEDVNIALSKEYFPNKKVDFVNVFLRWDKIITTREFVVPEHRKKTSDQYHREMISKAFEEAGGSSDWWRQIGAVLVLDGNVVMVSHNRHMPTDYHLSIYGDPRSNFDAGDRPDIYTSIHGEADIVAKAARNGVSLEGGALYVTTFPCSNCARLIGEAGIKKVFYSKGYSRLDAEEVLNHYGVEIFLVE